MWPTITFWTIAILAAFKIMDDALPYYPRVQPFEWLLELMAGLLAFTIAGLAALALSTVAGL